jgi:RimJ/RimL family protein N-acetyltransferase
VVVTPLVLRSPLLLLRPLCAEDAAPLASYRSIPAVARFQSWESFNQADAVRLVADQAKVVPDTPGTWLQLAIVLSTSGKMIGDCGIHFRGDDFQQVELGVTMSPTHQGQGLATEALASVLGYVFDGLGKHRVTTVTASENHAAAALFRRLGFRQEAHYVENVWFKGAWGSEYLFALLRLEWETLPISRRA